MELPDAVVEEIFRTEMEGLDGEEALKLKRTRYGFQGTGTNGEYVGDLDARIDSSVDPGLAEWMSKLESAFPFVTVNAPTEEVESDDHRQLVGAGAG